MKNKTTIQTTLHMCWHCKKEFPEQAMADVGGAIYCPFCVLKFMRQTQGESYKFHEKDQIARMKIAHHWLEMVAKQRKLAKRIRRNLQSERILIAGADYAKSTNANLS